MQTAKAGSENHASCARWNCRKASRGDRRGKGPLLSRSWLREVEGKLPLFCPSSRHYIPPTADYSSYWHSLHRRMYYHWNEQFPYRPNEKQLAEARRARIRVTHPQTRCPTVCNSPSFIALQLECRVLYCMMDSSFCIVSFVPTSARQMCRVLLNK